MWVLILRRVRLFLMIAVLLPVVSSLSRRMAERLERRAAGPTFGSRGLRTIEGVAGRARSALRR
ncbi:hypothetical protein [Cellulomonas sp. ICMP 17802]|uniref:hypothetical protein n=1 Tax=Cellulomonas sp. ICMP 17802 TaxID=3239199 RepID=UPI00351BD672